MREINKISESLFEKIRDRFEDVSLGDENAKATQDPEKARFFNFDYVIDGENHGNITMSVIDEISLKVYFSKNISHNMDEEVKKEWYAFLRELREFAKRNLLSFEPRDITRSTLKHRDVQQISKADSTYNKDEVVSESRMYGTMNRSYESYGPVRIKVQHSKPIIDEVHGARSRNIEAVFVENDQGERFRLPFNSLIGARAMARHVSAGGTPTDEFGSHITEMVGEMLTLRPFIHSMRHRTFEDVTTNEMLESAFEYHSLLKNTLKKMKGKKGYTACKESFTPTLNEQGDVDVDSIKEKFVKKVFPDKLAEALPIVHKAYTKMKENNNPYAQQFESWADTVAEGSWALPDSEDEVNDLIELLSEPLPVGVDAQNATNALYNILGDDQLFDRLGDLAEENPEADARDVVMGWVQENMPEVYGKIMSVIGDEEPADQTVGEDVNEGEYDEDQVESIQTAIIRRILNNIGEHSELLKKAGPDGVMNAARDVASFHAPVEELGSSDISIMVREVYREVGVEYPEMAEAKDTIKYDPKTGKLTGWEHEGDWKKQTTKKDPVGKIHHMSDVARRRTEKMAQSDTLEEAFEEALGEYDTRDAYELDDPKHPDFVKNYEEFKAKNPDAKLADFIAHLRSRKNESVAGDDHVNKDEKLKRMGAKELGIMDKLKNIPRGMKAMAKGDSEDDLVLYNKQFKEEIEQMRKIAGLK